MSEPNGHATTGTGQEPFEDLDRPKITDEEIARRLEKTKKTNAARQPSRRISRQFVRVPLEEAKKLDPVTLKVFMFLLHRSFQNHGPGFPAATDGLHDWGVSRWQKTRALNKLAKLGLIQLEWRFHKNPIVRRIDV